MLEGGGPIASINAVLECTKLKLGSERDVEQYSLGHPACPTPNAAVSLSEQQPYRDKLQCTAGETSETADEAGRKGEGRWKMAQEEKEQLSDYCRVGVCW